MKRMAIALVLVFLGLSIALSQSGPGPEVVNAQKTLKKILINETPSVNSVSFDGCRVSIKNVYSYDGYDEASGGSYVPDANTANLPGTGPDRLLRLGASDHYTLDLSKIDLSNVLVVPSVNKDRTIVTIPTPEQGALVPLKSEGPRVRDQYTLLTKRKSGDAVVKALQAYAAICK